MGCDMGLCKLCVSVCVFVWVCVCVYAAAAGLNLDVSLWRNVSRFKRSDHTNYLRHCFPLTYRTVQIVFVLYATDTPSVRFYPAAVKWKKQMEFHLWCSQRYEKCRSKTSTVTSLPRNGVPITPHKPQTRLWAVFIGNIFSVEGNSKENCSQQGLWIIQGNSGVQTRWASFTSSISIMLCVRASFTFTRELYFSMLEEIPYFPRTQYVIFNFGEKCMKWWPRQKNISIWLFTLEDGGQARCFTARRFAFLQWLLGLAPVPMWPSKDRQYRWMMDGCPCCPWL